jgi:amidophosphoribosyltransferase
MGGFFGVVSKDSCTSDLFYGTHYHSHLGTMRGGMAVKSTEGIHRVIHDITNAQFRSKFEDDIADMNGYMGIGVISDYEDQPLIIGSHLGKYAIVTVGMISNMNDLVKGVFRDRSGHFTGDQINLGTVTPGKTFSAAVPHIFNVYSFVLRGGKPVVDPEK